MVGCLAGAATWLALIALASLPPPVARLRRPVAAGFLDGGHTLCLANQRSGTVMLADIRQGRVRGEWAVGERLSGLAVLPDRRHVLTVDEKCHELVVLRYDGTRLNIQARLPVAPYPVNVAVTPDGRRATVASLWSRRVDVVDLTALSTPAQAAGLRVLHTIRLPFAPRGQCVLPREPYVVVADAFGGHLAVIDAAAGRLAAVHELNGHNLRGLAVSADGRQLLVTHQVLNQKAGTTRANIERGVLMANVMHSLPLDQVSTPGADLDKAGRLVHLGSEGHGAGDPEGIAVLDAGQFAVALGGVQEVALVEGDGRAVRRLAVGCRPTVLVSAGPQQPLVVVNTFADTLSLVNPCQGTVTRTISLGPPAELGPADQGELLFHDARLARDGWLSCQSCHTDGHTNGLLADTLGDNTYGTPKRTLTLLNTAMTDPWAWNGEMKYLHDQVRKSLLDTLHASNVSEQQVNDLTAFLHTLPPPPPVEPVTTDPADRAQVERGRRVFEEHGCVRCHIPPLTYTSHGVHDVGFADERGLRKFNPPSLRGVSQGYCFLHDNRAATLEEVFTKFRHKVGTDTSKEDLADLLRFLRSL
jgi:cytochrome c peroxidase